MKIYKLSQTTNPQIIEDVMGAVTTIQKAIAVINESLRIIEQNNVINLFSRENLIKEIQSGNIASLDINNIDKSLMAMSKISRTIPVINTALRTLQDNDAIARQLNVDIRNMQNVIIPSIQKGDFSQFVSILKGFSSMLPSMGGTVTGTQTFSP